MFHLKLFLFFCFSRIVSSKVEEQNRELALAVQAGKINFDSSQFSKDLEQLVIEMTNVDINFRINIESVIEKVEILMNKNFDSV